MIDCFNKEAFEAALPKHKDTGQPLWKYAGFIGGEFAYRLPVKLGVVIQIRSSVGRDGWSDDSGKNSIRCWVTDANGATLGEKYGEYITRLPGWQARLTEMLRNVWKLGRKLGCCHKCGNAMKMFCVQSGDNQGRWYQKCMQCNRWDSWLTDPIFKESKNGKAKNKRPPSTDGPTQRSNPKAVSNAKAQETQHGSHRTGNGRARATV